MRSESVAEITGPYGPVCVAERVVQSLWAEGVFSGKALRTVSGKTLVLTNPGAMNFHEGPDFREATFTLDGRSVAGDVEIHFYRDDWRAHGHALDPNFDGVALHAVVFPPAPGGEPARTLSGREPETLVLLPHLPDDLESAAVEHALLRAEGRPDDSSLIRILAPLTPAERESRLAAAALERWRAKIRFAKHRLASDGPESAAHRLFLETLGLRRNRAPMADLAARHTLADFAKADPEKLFEEMKGRWRLAGVRPANHPRARLAAYAKLAAQRPDLSALTEAFFKKLPPLRETGDTAAFRKTVGLTKLRGVLAKEILAGAVGGTRLDTLVIDALLPLHAARSGREDLFTLWRCWPLGDAPAQTPRILQNLALTGPGRPVSNGLFQGLIGL